MSNKKKNLKNSKVNTSKRILLLAIIVIFLMIITIVALLMKTTKKEEVENTMIMGIYDKTQDEIPSLKFTNISEIEVLSKGDRRQVDIAKKFENIFESEIPALYTNVKDLHESDISEYYDENEDKIIDVFYSINIEDFKSLCKKINSMESNLETDFTVCDFSQEDESLKVTCSYKNGEKIILKLSKNYELSFVE